MSNRSKKVGAIGMAALILGATLASTAPASAFPHHRFHGHRGLGVGAAVGLGVQSRHLMEWIEPEPFWF